MGSDMADLMYSDPPWGEGNIKYWATMNQKMTGELVQPAPLVTFLDSIFSIAQRYVTSYLLIEYGVRWRDMIQQRGVQAGFTPVSIIDILYRGGGKLLPLDMHVFTRGPQPLPAGYVEGVAGSHGYDCVSRAVRPLAGLLRSPERTPILLDPCCGMGYMAQAAVDNGMAFRGNELNHVRLQKTIARLL